MAEIEILSLVESGRFKSIFKEPQSAEGSWGWFESLAETTLTRGEEAVFAVAFDGIKARAALPLVRNGAFLRGLTAPYTTHYMPAFADAEWARFLGAGARSYVKGSLQLDALDSADTNTAAFLDGVKSSGLVAAQYRSFSNFYESTDNFAAYWLVRPSRLKSTVRRKLAQAIGEQAEFRCYRGALDEAIEAYEEVYAASWKAAEPHPHFIRTMLEKLSPYGFVRIGVMSLRGSPMAAQIWLVCKRRATIFKLGHREEVKALSPGTLLTHWMLSTLIDDEGLTEVDFGRGSDAYKRDWLPNCRFRCGIVAGNWKTLSGVAVIAGQVVPTWLSGLARSGGK